MRDRLLRLNLQFFAEQSDPNAGAANNPDPAANPEGNQQQEPQQQEPKQQQQEKLLPQSDVNNLIAKETKRAQEKLLKQLGVEDFKSAKEGLAKFQEWQESQKTEAEKMADSLKDYETKYNTVSSENESLKAQISAMKLGVNADSVPDVVALAKNYVSDEVDMNAAMKMVVEKYPHFKGQQQEEAPQPKFTNGEHKKQPTTELDAWAAAFRN